MKLSIVIPCYQAEKYISETLASIINSREGFEKDVEIICIDDCSRDNTALILKKFSESNLNIVCKSNRENYGVSKSRNVGIDLSRGDYIWFVDSDDLVSDEAISSILSAIDKSKVDVVVFNANVFTPSNKISFLNDRYRKALTSINRPEGRLSPLYLVTNLWICCINKNIIIQNKIEFDVDKKCFEDWLFLWNYYKHTFSALYLDQKLYNYRHRFGDSLVTKELSNLNVSELFNVCKKSLKDANLDYEANEQFCLIRANDILQFFILTSRLTDKDCKKIVDEYSMFINSINYEMRAFLQSNSDPFCKKIISYTQTKKGRFKLMLKLLVKDTKLAKYVNVYSLMLKEVRKPFITFFNWLRACFNLIVVLIKMLVRTPMVIYKIFRLYI